MTESGDLQRGRLDLRALGAGVDDARTEAIIGMVISRIGARRQRAGDIETLRRMQRRLMVAAAVLAAIATASVVASPRRQVGMPAADLVASWSQANHVPTNGELVAVFRGYRP